MGEGRPASPSRREPPLRAFAKRHALSSVMARFNRAIHRRAHDAPVCPGPWITRSSRVMTEERFGSRQGAVPWLPSSKTWLTQTWLTQTWLTQTWLTQTWLTQTWAPRARPHPAIDTEEAPCST